MVQLYDKQQQTMIANDKSQLYIHYFGLSIA